LITRHALVAAPLTAWIAVLSPACAEAPAARPVAKTAPLPSKLDFLVLASFADAANMLALSAYSEPAQAVTESGARP
jgi:hypothetical protein